MKKLLIGLFAVLGLIATMSVAGVNAAPESVGAVGPYEGVFHGTITAPDGSQAPMSLDLTHRGSVVKGTVSLGEGLHIDAGMCGEAAIPASTIYAAGETDPWKRGNLSAASSFDVGGVTVKVIMDSTISGYEIDTQAKIDLPWLCGSDPVITGTLYRA